MSVCRSANSRDEGRWGWKGIKQNRKPASAETALPGLPTDSRQTLQNWQQEKMILNASKLRGSLCCWRSTKIKGKSFIHHEVLLAKLAAEGKNQIPCCFYIPLTLLKSCHACHASWQEDCMGKHPHIQWTKSSQLSNYLLVDSTVTSTKMYPALTFFEILHFQVCFHFYRYLN